MLFSFRNETKELQAAVYHSDERYQCQKMSDCPYTGTTIINKIPWPDWSAGEDEGETMRIRRREEEDIEEKINIEEYEIATIRERILSFEKLWSK